MENGIMQMRGISVLEIPAGKPVRLAPRGYHAMLMGLVKQLHAGEHFPLELTFRRAGKVTADVVVERIGATGFATMPGMIMGDGH